MSLKQKIETATSIILTVCAVAVTASVVRSQVFPPKTNTGELQAEAEPNWKQYAVGDMTLGPQASSVTITEFSDFECPVCYRLYRSLTALKKQHPNIRVVYRNYPLTELHPSAQPAAIAAQCAAKQGRFEEYHNALFDRHDELKSVRWTPLADSIGIRDTAQFAKCLASQEVLAQLRTDSLAAMSLKIPGTPLVLINDQMYRGAPSLAVLDSLAKKLAR